MKLHVAKLHASIVEAIVEHDREIVERMVDYLFANQATGLEVSRLVLIAKNGTDIGGWGKEPLKRQLIELLAPRIKKSRAG